VIFPEALPLFPFESVTVTVAVPVSVEHDGAVSLIVTVADVAPEVIVIASDEEIAQA